MSIFELLSDYFKFNDESKLLWNMESIVSLRGFVGSFERDYPVESLDDGNYDLVLVLRVDLVDVFCVKRGDIGERGR